MQTSSATFGPPGTQVQERSDGILIRSEIIVHGEFRRAFVHPAKLNHVVPIQLHLDSKGRRKQGDGLLRVNRSPQRFALEERIFDLSGAAGLDIEVVAITPDLRE